MEVSVFLVTLSEDVAIREQLQAYTNDRDERGNERTPLERTLSAVGVVLGKQVERDLRANVEAGEVFWQVVAEVDPRYRFRTAVVL